MRKARGQSIWISTLQTTGILLPFSKFEISKSYQSPLKEISNVIELQRYPWYFILQQQIILTVPFHNVNFQPISTPSYTLLNLPILPGSRSLQPPFPIIQ